MPLLVSSVDACISPIPFLGIGRLKPTLSGVD